VAKEQLPQSQNEHAYATPPETFQNHHDQVAWMKSQHAIMLTQSCKIKRKRLIVGYKRKAATPEPKGII
jgi:hypothetical protein